MGKSAFSYKRGHELGNRQESNEDYIDVGLFPGVIPHRNFDFNLNWRAH